MQELYKEYIKRPSLRFLQKSSGMELRNEQKEKRKSARTTQMFAFRNIDLDEKLEEDTNEEDSQNQENVATVPSSVKPAEAKARNRLEQQKSKLERWMAEKERKKAKLMNSKKPFISCVHPKYAQPKFLTSRPSICPMETRASKAQQKPISGSGAKPSSAPLKTQNRNRQKESSKPFESNISSIKPSTGVSFAPHNFKFTYTAPMTSKAKKATPAAANSACSSTPYPEIKKTGKQNVNCPRRSKRIAMKDQAHPASCDQTFLVPRPVAQGKKKDEVGLPDSPKTVGQSIADLMLFTP